MSDTPSPGFLHKYPLVPIAGSNNLAEREIGTGVFLIYDVSQDRRHQSVGCVFTNCAGSGWQYSSKDGDWGIKGHPTKGDAIKAMQAAITLRENDIDAYQRGLRYRVNNPGGWVYAWELDEARKLRSHDEAEIIEFNKYGGTYPAERCYRVSAS